MSQPWALSSHIDLRSDRLPERDARRQMQTAAEICRRLNSQPGVVLADDVGMGKTFVALAVAASIAQQDPTRQIVVMVPTSVGDKWPKDWSVFQARCLHGGPPIRATGHTVRRGAEFLKLLDEPPETRHQIIFLSHWALSTNLDDPFIKLALVRTAFRYQRDLQPQRQALPRWAQRLFNRSDFSEAAVEALLAAEPGRWRGVWQKQTGKDLQDDPVPTFLIEAFNRCDLREVREALGAMPLRQSANLDVRIKQLRSSLSTALNQVWKDALRELRAHMSLLILDEAHHLKNPNQLRALFQDGQDEPGGNDANRRGMFSGVFERMLLLTATPFQLGHRELIAVLRLFGSTRLDALIAESFETGLKALSSALDAAQAASLRLDQAWGRVQPHDLDNRPARWWAGVLADAPEHLLTVARQIQEATMRLQAASKQLKPWVIRHSKDRQRVYLSGLATLPEAPADGSQGLPVEGPGVLPFLLAARAQALVSLRGLQDNRKSRALFADGLASSFEAFRSTRSRDDEGTRSPAEQTDDVELSDVKSAACPELDWYLDQIDAALPSGHAAARASHPKVRATVARAIAHWRQGEKVLVLCFYRATGRALREHLSAAIGEEIRRAAEQRFGIRGEHIQDVFDQLGERADSILRRDRPGGERVHAEAVRIAAQAGLDGNDVIAFADVVLRFMRTPSFLVRHVDLNLHVGEDAVANSFSVIDGSGMSLAERLAAFAARVAGLTADQERPALWANLKRFRTGNRHVDAEQDVDGVEQGADGIALVPNVHLANGETDLEQRIRLMSTFNTPFLPEILVASSVMAEGVDLHRECRHVIHHDLDWNPSTLEQRTGRIERLGSKALATGQSIVVCEPYVAGTQDEKQYRVVKDRERWFGVLMGGRVPDDEWSKDRLADRVPLPVELLEELVLDLSVWSPI